MVLVWFALIKFIGYTIYSYCLQNYMFPGKADRGFKSIVVMGGTRTVIGFVGGTLYGFLLLTGLFDRFMPNNMTGYLIGLLPFRLIEWGILIGVFFFREGWGRQIWAVVLGVIVTYGLDLISIMLGLIPKNQILNC